MGSVPGAPLQGQGPFPLLETDIALSKMEDGSGNGPCPFYWEHQALSLYYCPSLVPLGLPVRYETLTSIGCFVIFWSKYSPGNTSHQMHYGLTWPVRISTGFQIPLRVSMNSPDGRQFGCREGCAKGLWKRVFCHTLCHHVSPRHSNGFVQSLMFCWILMYCFCLYISL